jgi:hypothetical protein
MLTIDFDYFKIAIEKLRQRLKESADDIKFAFLGDSYKNATWHEKIRAFFGLKTEKNLRRFEQDGYYIPKQAFNCEDTKDLVQSIIPAYSIHCSRPSTARAS